jgi:large subunit ribosomal protein L5
MATKLKITYKDKIVPNLYKSLGYKNIQQVPKLLKIQINRGLGLEAQNTAILNKTIEEFRLISGQQPIITKSRKSVAGFKLREEINLGVTVTLRGEKMYAFFERFINLALPRSRDFQGLNPKGFDHYGNYTMGITDQLIFPEISFSSVDKTFGFDITFVTNATNRDEGSKLLFELGLPIREKILT